MHLGYEPSRITNLTQQSRWAVGALDGIHTTDPAAADAMAAIATLKSVIANGFIPATTTVGIVDPLGDKGATPSSLAGVDWYADWLSSVVVTDYAHMTDDELFAELERLEESLPYDDDIEPDMSDPFWIEFEQLARELAVRAETDEDFAERLADQAFDTFLIPIALQFARFSPDVVADMLATVSEWPSWSVDLQTSYRNLGAGLLLDFLADFPIIALDLLSDLEARPDRDNTLLEELLLWPGLDPDAVNRFLDAAMSAPFIHPDLLPQAGVVLQQLVEIANGPEFPDGFPPAISPTLSKIIVQYLPFFVTSLNGRGDVHLKDFDLRDLRVELGSYAEVVDLLGALMRDATSLDVLLAIIPALTVLGSDQAGPLDATLSDVANYLNLLRNAAGNEQLEEELAAARDRSAADLTIDLIFDAVKLITSATGPLTVGGVAVPLEVFEGSAKRFADWAITTTDLGLDQVSTIAYLLMIYGISIAIVSDRRGDNDARTSENVDWAEEIIADIDNALESGQSIDDVEGLLGDLQRVVESIDDETTEILTDPRVRPPEYDVVAQVDTED